MSFLVEIEILKFSWLLSNWKPIVCFASFYSHKYVTFVTIWFLSPSFLLGVDREMELLNIYKLPVSQQDCTSNAFYFNTRAILHHCCNYIICFSLSRAAYERDRLFVSMFIEILSCMLYYSPNYRYLLASLTNQLG